VNHEADSEQTDERPDHNLPLQPASVHADHATEDAEERKRERLGVAKVALMMIYK
jgi:hypothetical protein